MRSKAFWLIVLAVAILAGIISCMSSNTSGHSGTNTTPVPILPDIYDNEDVDGYLYQDMPYLEPWDEYETTPEPTPDPGLLDMQSDTVFVAGRYAGFFTWGHFHHSAVDEPVVFAESTVLDTYTDVDLDISDIIDMEQLELVFALLAEAILAYAPESAPFLFRINENWLTNMVIDHEGLRVLLTPDIAPWDLGFFSVLISYEDLGEAFLLEVELGLREPPRLPMVALTFDDGPHFYTDIILDILEEHGGRATFCVLGYRIHYRPNTVIRAVNLGHEVVGHSWDHSDLTRLNANAISNQITRTSAAIEEVTGVRPPPIFRAPFGLTNTRVINVSRDLGYSLLHWSVDPQDWANRDVDHIYNHIMDRAMDGAIILLHDIHTTTAEAMKLVIPRLIEEGFQLVTASELIAYFYGETEPGEIYMGHRPPWF
ncbi:MAG: polysaccharide deacetylase family protein [Defluviitaleaceae bacterium]|nr:polysaccharide deacetylase family protein [Defluviitaleaceae bacterium]